MQYFIENHDNLLYVLGSVALILELSVLGLSGPLLFFGIGCIFTGILVSTGLITSWEYEVLTVGVMTIISTLLLWKPLKKLQGNGKATDTSSDMIGQIVLVSETVTKVSGSIRHSGINWQARLPNDAHAIEIEAGVNVEIFAVDGTTMMVKRS